MHSLNNFYFWSQPTAEILHTSEVQGTKQIGGFTSNK